MNGIEAIPKDMPANWWALCCLIVLVLGGGGVGVYFLFRLACRLLAEASQRASHDLDKVLKLHVLSAKRDRRDSAARVREICEAHENAVSAICETHRSVAGEVRDLAISVRDNTIAVRELTARGA